MCKGSAQRAAAGTSSTWYALKKKNATPQKKLVYYDVRSIYQVGITFKGSAQRAVDAARYARARKSTSVKM